VDVEQSVDNELLLWLAIDEDVSLEVVLAEDFPP
jgi:hypothetical protein